MTISALPTGSATGATTRSEVAVEALARAMRQKRQEADALVRLVEQVTAAGDKGQHVSYYG
jgi:Tfp pilus assembly protein FimT